MDEVRGAIDKAERRSFLIFHCLSGVEDLSISAVVGTGVFVSSRRGICVLIRSGLGGDELLRLALVSDGG